MYTSDIDCLENGAPHSRVSKKFVALIDTIPNTKEYNFLRCYVVFDLFHKIERLTTDTNFKMSEFISIMEDEIRIIKSILSSTESYKHKLQRDEDGELFDDFKEFTQSHYGNLFSNFSEYHYYDEPYELLTERLKKSNITLDVNNKTALDAGCGGGRYTVALKKMGFDSVHGIDFSEINVNTAKKMQKNTEFSNIEYRVGDVLNLPYKDECFDFAFSNGVLHHSSSILKGLQEMQRVLKTGGIGWLYLIEKPGGVHWDTVELLRRLIKPVSQEYARYALRMFGVPVNRVFYILDHIMVPINTRLTCKEVESMLTNCGFVKIKRLNRGVDFDRIEHIHRSGGGDSESIWKYGVGEHRYIFEKNS